MTAARTTAPVRRGPSVRRLVAIIASLFGLLVVAAALTGWTAYNQAQSVRDDLTSARAHLERVRTLVSSGKADQARTELNQARALADNARETSHGWIWSLGTHLPGYGDDVTAVQTVTDVTASLTGRAFPPLVDAASTLSPQALAPKGGRIAIAPIAALAPPLRTAATSLDTARTQLTAIPTAGLQGQVRDGVSALVRAIDDIRPTVRLGEQISTLAPQLLGAGGPRHYLLLFQNNADVRASGGIAGSVAQVDVVDGRVTMGRKSSAAAVGVFPAPVLPLGSAEAIHSDRLGRYLQDVNLSPDFPTSAALAREMWRRYTTTLHAPVTVDGVVSVDPIALSHLLRGAPAIPLKVPGLPSSLTADNTVSTLLSTVYSAVPDTELQDQVFAGVAGTVFDRLTKGAFDWHLARTALGQSVDEGRLRLWSAHPEEQRVVAETALSGALPTGAAARGAFGVYLNDAATTKLSYYLRQKVSLVRDCASPTTVRVRLDVTNTLDAGTLGGLTEYVKGRGDRGAPLGALSNIVHFYLPPGTSVAQVTVDGQPVGHSWLTERGRPVTSIGLVTPLSKTSHVEAVVTGVAPAARLSLAHTPIVTDTPTTVPAACQTGR